MFGLSAGSVGIGKTFFRTLAPFYIIYGFSMVIRGYIEGIGDMVFSSVAGVIALFARIARCYLMVDLFAGNVLAIAEGFSWIILLGIYMVRYWRNMSKRRMV